jgi:glucokinase
MKNLLSKGDHVVGLDIGGTKIMAAVLNHKFEVVGRCKKKSKKGGESTEDRICRIIEEALEDAGKPSIRGIGVGSPGPLDPKTGVIIDTPNLGWKDFPLADMLADAFGVVAIVDNDVNVGTYGEYCFSKLSGCANVIGIFPGTGIGGGIIIDQRIFHGFSGAAGEIGHMTVEVDGPFCGCGKRGCLEAVASRVAIAKEVAALAAREDAPFIQDKTKGRIDKIKSGVLAEAVDKDEAMVEAVVRRAAYYVGVAAGNLINILSPEAVVLGGGLVEAMEKLFLEEVKRGVDDHAMPFLRKGVRISAARLGDDAVVLGGAHLVAEQLTGVATPTG